MFLQAILTVLAPFKRGAAKISHTLQFNGMTFRIKLAVIRDGLPVAGGLICDLLMYLSGVLHCYKF